MIDTIVDITGERAIKQFVYYLNKFRYVSLLEHNKNDYILKNDVLRKAFITTHSAKKSLVLKYGFGKKLCVNLANSFDDITFSILYMHSNLIVLHFCGYMLAVSSYANIDYMNIEDNNFELNVFDYMDELNCRKNANRYDYSCLIPNALKVYIPYLDREKYSRAISNFNDLLQYIQDTKVFKYISILKDVPNKYVS